MKNQSKFKFTNTDPQQISSIIKSIDSSKAVGPNSIPPKVLSKIAPIISGVLAKIINTSLNTAKFPTKMKICKINPVHKKESKLKISNYRPISLLSNLNKILKKLCICNYIPFWKKIIANMIYNSVFDKNTLQIMPL